MCPRNLQKQHYMYNCTKSYCLSYPNRFRSQAPKALTFWLVHCLEQLVQLTLCTYTETCILSDHTASAGTKITRAKRMLRICEWRERAPPIRVGAHSTWCSNHNGTIHFDYMYMIVVYMCMTYTCTHCVVCAIFSSECVVYHSVWRNCSLLQTPRTARICAASTTIEMVIPRSLSNRVAIEALVEAMNIQYGAALVWVAGWWYLPSFWNCRLAANSECHCHTDVYFF